MKCMLITNDPEVAGYADHCGVDRVFIDMESLGKEERQGHLDTHKAVHTINDLESVRSVVTHSELMARLNPLYQGTQYEVDAAISVGADRLMLPMFESASDVESFQQAVRGRVPVTYLAELPQSLETLPSWIRLLSNEDQVHIGLNDLSLALGLSFLFEPLSRGLLEQPTAYLRNANVEFGIGGVARPGRGELPADWVLGEHVRLGSNWAILSRAFHGRAQTLKQLQSSLDLEEEVESLRAVYDNWGRQPRSKLLNNQERLIARVSEISAEMQAGRGI